MPKPRKRTIGLLAAICMSLQVAAQTAIVDGIEWTYEVVDGAVNLYNYGDVVVDPWSAQGDLEIPAAFGEYPVVNIGRGAFENCFMLTSVTIPNSVTNIGMNAFNACECLTNIVVGSGVRSIGSNAFLGCDGIVLVFEGDEPSVGNYVFPGTCTFFIKKSANWNVTNGEWGGHPIVYLDPDFVVTFAAGGATEGTVPNSIGFYVGESVTLPGCGSLRWPLHSFAGWSDGANCYAEGAAYSNGTIQLTAQWQANTLAAPVINAPATFDEDSVTVTITAETGASIHYTLDGTTPTAESPLYAGPLTITDSTTVKAIATREDHFDSEVAVRTVTKAEWSFGACVNSPNLTFTTGGDADWEVSKNPSRDGHALRSGEITHNQTSRLDLTVSGPGTLSFYCKVKGEFDKNKKGVITDRYDGLAFYIDGMRQDELIVDVDEWSNMTFQVVGNGEHLLSWRYEKDNDGSVEEDFAVLDNVVWIPERGEGQVPDGVAGESLLAIVPSNGTFVVSARVGNAVHGWTYQLSASANLDGPFTNELNRVGNAVTAMTDGPLPHELTYVIEDVLKTNCFFKVIAW